jgi:SAM-dependent methyltransferase
MLGGARGLRMDRHSPELSDLIVEYDPSTLERRDVRRQAVLARLAEARAPWPARRVARGLPVRGDVLDPDAMDGSLVRAHLELQRLHEEFRIGTMVRDLLRPMIDFARRHTGERRIRIVDLGCGLGFMLRWLAARGDLGRDVELIGADYNRALLAAAQRLADEEGLACRFVAASAFALREPAHIVLSTGVLHHFRGDDLAAVFTQHERSTVAGFVHIDVRPSLVAPIGSWVFHQARMREPLARFDGVQSTVRAHRADTLRDAVARGAPSFALGMLDARPGIRGLLRIFQAAIGMRTREPRCLREAYASWGRRFESV